VKNINNGSGVWHSDDSAFDVPVTFVQGLRHAFTLFVLCCGKPPCASLVCCISHRLKPV